ncbi:MAG: sulfatase-like hydrolase/transferase, partial [Gammaproteobacteria bacterium]|nr:sulfatase-like hydrolase/transferase [Gammaproteobacteria bacterium]
MRWATVTLLAALAAAPAVAGERPPNVVLLIGDDVGYPYFGFMGDDNVVTPASDALAAGGYTFSQGHVTAPYCRPSLRTLITGLHPVQYSLRLDALIEERKLENGFASMPREQQTRWLTVVRAAGMSRFDTLPALLGEQGYVSWQGGKWWEGSHRNGHFDEGMTRDW